MCEDFPLYTFNNEIVSYMGITCTKTDLFKDLILTKDIHDALKIIDKRFTFTINDNKIIYDFINFTLEINLISYKFENHEGVFDMFPRSRGNKFTCPIVCNIKDFIENFNIMLVSLDIYNKKYYKYNHSISIINTMQIKSLYAGIYCDTCYASYHIHQNIEILMDFLSQNFVNSDIDYNMISFVHINNIICVRLCYITVNNKCFYDVFETIDYIKTLIPELFEQKIAL